MLDRLPDRAPRRSLPPDWGVHHDNRLRDTGGRYRAIAALADEWRVATRVLVARHHRLRAEGVPPVPEPVMGPAERAVAGEVTPLMRVILREMELKGPCTYADLEAAANTDRGNISACIKRFERLLLHHGFRMRRSRAWRGKHTELWMEALA